MRDSGTGHKCPTCWGFAKREDLWHCSTWIMIPHVGSSTRTFHTCLFVVVGAILYAPICWLGVKILVLHTLTLTHNNISFQLCRTHIEYASMLKYQPSACCSAGVTRWLAAVGFRAEVTETGVTRFVCITIVHICAGSCRQSTWHWLIRIWCELWRKRCVNNYCS